MKHIMYLLVIALVGLSVMLFGCSEKIVNPDGDTQAEVRISATAALAAGVATYARIRVTAADMLPLSVPMSFDSAGNMWSASLSVPSGLERAFVLEAFDTLWGEGSIPSTEELVYIASDTVDLVAGTTDTLDFQLFPVVPLLTTSPSMLRLNMGQQFVLNAAFYNVPSNLYGMSYRIYYPPALVIADSVQFFFTPNDSVITFAQIDRATGFVAISISETNPAQTPFHGAAFAPVAKIYCRLASASNLSAAYIFSSYPEMVDASQTFIYPEHFRTGWTDVIVNVAAQ